jgi:hypothetical protein
MCERSQSPLTRDVCLKRSQKNTLRRSKVDPAKKKNNYEKNSC